MKYRMYIDEVGNPDLKNSENSLHRFLSLTGVIANLKHVRQRKLDMCIRMCIFIEYYV
jgi:hypothetical protein